MPVKLLLGVDGAPEVGIMSVVLGLELGVCSSVVTAGNYLDERIVVEIGGVCVVALSSELKLEITVSCVACVLNLIGHHTVI